MTEERLTIEDRVLFTEIANDIKSNPKEYQEAGDWLNRYCTEDSFRQRIKERLQSYEAVGAPFEREAEILRFMLEEEAYQTLDMLHKMDIERENTQDNIEKIVYLKAFLVATKKIEGGTVLRYLWFDTMDFLTKYWPHAPFLSSQNARRVLLMTWLITDPDTDSSGLNITKLEELPWRERYHLSSHTLSNIIGGLPDPSREGKEQQWMKAVRAAWIKIQAEKEPSSEEHTKAGQNDKPTEQTPKTDSNLIYQSDASEFYNIPKSMLSKNGRKTPGEPGHLWSGTEGRRRFYRKADIEKISRSRQKLKGI